MIEVNGCGPRVTVEGRCIALEQSVWSTVAFEDRAVVQTCAWGENWPDEATFDGAEITPYYCNVLAFDADGERVWQVDEPPHEAPEAVLEEKSFLEPGEPYFMGLQVIDGELWARNANRRRYRLDPGTGEYRESLPGNELPTPEGRATFPEGTVVDDVVDHEGLRVVTLKDHEDQRNCYALAPDGEVAWRAPTPDDGWPYVGVWVDDEGRLRARSGCHRYVLDPETGRKEASQFFK